MSDPWVLGLAASHGGAACLMRGHRIVCAIQEERLTRVKHAPLAPAREFRALDYLLDAAGITVDDLDLVVCCPLQSPRGASDVSRHPRLSARPHAVISHHLGHAISAYACSGFADATVIVIDGMGSRLECLSDAERDVAIGPGGREVMSIYRAFGHTVLPVEKHLGTQSLGTMYQNAAEQVFGSWHDAGKLMGLAAYGTVRWPLSAFVEFDETRLRVRPDVVTDNHRDLAASVQAALEAGVGWLVHRARSLAPSPRLCYAGGVALNLPANERHLMRSGFDDVFIQPAAEDAGTAIGAAYYGVWQLTGTHEPQRMDDDGWGRRYGEVAGHAIDRVADLVAAHRLVGWFEGRAEFGPRALGHRSILANPCRAETKAALDRAKQREPFRPYAPAVLAPHAVDWFDTHGRPVDSPFMLRAVPFRVDQRPRVPVVVHVDGTGRLQTVTPDGGPFGALIDAVCQRTGVPMVVNTSFNERGQPIVETPGEALAAARRMGLDACVIDGALWLAD